MTFAPVTIGNPRVVLRARALGCHQCDGSDYASPDAAKRAALRAVIAIAADEIHSGNKSSIVEAQLLDGKHIAGRFVAALSVEALPLS